MTRSCEWVEYKFCDIISEFFCRFRYLWYCAKYESLQSQWVGKQHNSLHTKSIEIMRRRHESQIDSIVMHVSNVYKYIVGVSYNSDINPRNYNAF